MAITLNRKFTSLFVSMRTMENGETEGNYFKWAIEATEVITNTEYENLVSFYLIHEELADDGDLIGTKADNSTYTVAARPTRPNPIPHRP